MGVKGVLKNIRRQGVGKTIRLARERTAERRRWRKVFRQLEQDAAKSAEFAIAVQNDPSLMEEYQRHMLSFMSVLEQEERWSDGECYQLFQKQLDQYCAALDAMDEKLSERISASVEWFNSELAAHETSLYKRALKADFIKRRIPAAYDCLRNSDPVQEALFVQPRSGLNQTFKHPFHYLEQNGPYKPVLLELHRGDLPYSFYYRNAEAMARRAGAAQVTFFHESNDLLGHVEPRKDTKIVQLWHGCGVFKKIGLDTAGQPGYKSVKAYEEYPEYNYYSCVTIASPELSWVFEQFMGISKESGIIKPLGVSRTDEFFDQTYIDRCYEKLYERIPEARDKKVILYAPTYRGLGRNRVAPDELDIPAMAERLGDTHILLIKQHQTAKDCPPVPEPYDQSFAWDVTRGWGMDINELMTIADVCVSDYSSLVFEYSIFERPMAFFVYDLDEYIDDRGLYYDFDEITPGPLCFTTNELIEYIEGIERNGFDPAEVAAFKERFMCSCDGHSTERILEYIENGD